MNDTMLIEILVLLRIRVSTITSKYSIFEGKEQCLVLEFASTF